MRINNNLAALNAWRNLTSTDTNMNKALERLSSGYRINRAADDAAGLAITEKMRGQIQGLRSATSNAQNGISLIQTAEGALTEVHSILQRMRDLSVQGANDTMTDTDRAELQKEVTRLKDEIDRIGNDTEFNTRKLLNGSLTEATTAQGTVMKSVALTNGTVGTAATSAGTLASLADANANNFSLASGSVIHIEGYKDNGTKVSVDFTVATALATVGDLMGQISTAFGIGTVAGSQVAGAVTIDASGKVVVTGDTTTSQALWGLKLSVTDKTLFNDKMSNFEETQAAKDTATDQSLSLQLGANANQNMSVGVSDMRKAALALQNVDIGTKQGAQNALSVVDRAITSVSQQRSTLGAAQNRLQYTINNLGVAVENLVASESRIRDVDMASEMTNFTRQQILVQAGTAMLAQANQKPQAVLQLLR